MKKYVKPEVESIDLTLNDTIAFGEGTGGDESNTFDQGDFS